MTKNFVIVLLFSLLTINLLAQDAGTNPPDQKKITRQLSKDDELYSELMIRYRSNDTSLTLADYHLIYYGYAFQPGYNPQKSTVLSDSLKQLFSNTGNTNDFRALKDLSFHILDQLPFDIRTLDPAIYATSMLRESDLASKLEFRMGRIIETIFNSGDGLTENTAFYVISESNMPDVVRALGFTLLNPVPEKSNAIYYLRVKENDFGINGFYFRVFGN